MKLKKYFRLLLVFLLAVFSPVKIVSATNGSLLTDLQLQKMIEVAKDLDSQNIKYVSGFSTSPDGSPLGQNPSPENGFDCDSLVRYVYKEATGFELPNRPENYQTFGVEISIDDIQPGDIIGMSLNNNNNGFIDHVLIYLGDVDGTGEKIVQATDKPDNRPNPEIDREVILEDASRYLDPSRWNNYRVIRIYGVNNPKRGDYFVKHSSGFSAVTSSNNRDATQYILDNQFANGTYIDGIDFDNNYIRFIYNGPDSDMVGKVAYIPKKNVVLSPNGLEPLNRFLPQGDLEDEIKSNNNLYITQPAKIFDMNGQVIGTKVKSEVIQGYQEGDFYVFYENGKFKKVSTNLVSENKVLSRVKVLSTSHILTASQPTEVLAKNAAVKDSTLEGYFNQDWFYFEYNGVLAKINKSKVEILPEKQDELFYIKSDAQIRDLQGNPVTVFLKGKSFIGSLEGNYYNFFYNNKQVRVHKSMVSSDIVKGNVYLTSRANIRDAKDFSIIGILNKGQYVNGYQKYDYIYFDYNGELAKIYAPLAIFANSQKMYMKTNANVRDYNGNIVKTAFKGELHSVVKIGNQYRYVQDNQIRFVHESFMTTNGVVGGFFASTNLNIRDLNGNLIDGMIRHGEYQEGIRIGDYLHFTYKGRKAKIYFGYVQYGIYEDIEIKTDANVRNNSNKVVGLLKKGTKLRAIKLGNYYRYLENGQVRLIWHTSVK